MSVRRLLIGITLLVLGEAPAWADAYVRVIAQRAPVHSGPAASYREVYFAERGQVFPVLERGTRDYWFKVELDDGTSGWILGDVVFPFEVGPSGEDGVFTRMGGAIKDAVLGPSPVTTANVGISFSAGVLDREGMYLLRPQWLIDSYWAVEGFGGLSPRADKDIFLGGLGFVLRLIPGAVIGPYADLSLGAAHIRPKADNFVDPKETLMALAAGGGLEITFKKQITVRLDARNWSLFNQNKSSNGQEYTGGLAIFF
ncbi:MAG TPA: SH3 domain-containing protein [Kofleriaceae bacterium]|nr:SH3 domain-containing protein [Kofleriaceae bacterium]